MSEQLDQSQLQFCEAPGKNIRLLAPAGCGKTLSLLFRCKVLSERAKPQRPRFLIVTFTVAARQELASRLNTDDSFASFRDAAEITTLNSWGFRRIKNVATYPKLITSKQDYHFAMLNQLQPIWKTHDMVKRAIEQSQFTTPRQLMDAMDKFKSIGFDHIRHDTFEKFTDQLRALRSQGLAPRLQELTHDLARVNVLDTIINKKGEETAQASDRNLYDAFYCFWREATAQLITNATFTLEDQKYFAYLDEKEKLEKNSFLSGAASYDHVLVDEFQDINPLDLALIKTITERSRAGLTIVGDDDQAIYEWRGATPEYILDPGRYFGTQFDTFTLAINYRSPNNIVDFSQALISHNTRRVAKSIKASRAEKATIEICKTTTLSHALELTYDEVRSVVGAGSSPSKVAIIGRKRSQLIPYQLFFASREVSFCAAEDLQVFMSVAFDRLLRLMMIKNRSNLIQMRTQVVDDLVDLCNLVKRYPLNKKDKDSLRKYLTKSGANNVNKGLLALSKYDGPLKGTNSEKRMSRALADAIAKFLLAKTVSESLLSMGLYFEGLQVDFGKAQDDIFFADPPFLQLAEYAIRYGDDYGLFVEEIERAKDQLAYIPPFEDEEETSSAEGLWKRPVHLMTALRAKGKEFESVVLLDVNDGIWPHKYATTLDQREAERRVFYVGFTRAKKKVLMLVSKTLANKPASPSPFIEELGLVV